MRSSIAAWLILATTTLGCSAEASSPATPADVDGTGGSASEGGAAASDAGKTGTTTDPALAGDAATRPGATLKFKTDVTAVTSVAQAIEGTFIPPYRSCVDPVSGGPGASADGKVCTNVAISGATEPGRYFPDYASCDLVRTQRPFWSRPPAGVAKPDDPRLNDTAYLAELGWVKQQIEATGCVCCHDSRVLDGKQAGQWDIELGPLWLDSLSDSGLALFAGLADSSSLGAYPADDNFGFERDLTGIPSTDGPRMQRFMVAELTRRGISEQEARAVPPFGGPIYQNRVAKPTPCEATEGVFQDGSVRWKGGAARYVYVGTKDSPNPGVPPNLDQPAGTLFRLDVLPSAAPVASGFLFGTTPEGSFQASPESTPAAPLVVGETYHLTVLRDVGLPVANCLFVYGEQATPVDTSSADAGPALPTADGGVGGSGATAGSCSLAGGNADGFGAPCRESGECTCKADYCALMPGQAMGYCSKTGCKEDKSVCPADYSCFDISAFAPGQPSVCTK